MSQTLAEPAARIECYLDGSLLPAMAADVRAGLSRELKELPPKYLYDARGSELFDRITTLPEYYPTRCERAILNRHAPGIVAAAGPVELVELGPGDASKTRSLLYAMAGSGALLRYLPFDVSEAVVTGCAAELVELYPGLRVHGVVGDFERHLGHLPRGGRRLVAFLGGTIGNLYPAERARFLRRLAGLLEDGDRLLVGIDLVKEHQLLEAAYNDSAGVTAEFNRNVLRVVNARLGGDFRPDAFEHVAFFDPERSWIEMRLRARAHQRVRIAGAELELDIPDGEEIRTEISTKFSPPAFEAELEEAGMRPVAFYTDPDGLFGLSVAGPG